MIDEFAKICGKLETAGKSVSQMAVQLVLLVHACPGLVGSYAQSLLDSAASSQGTEERWRDALPLPVNSGLASLVGGILKHKEFKLKKAGMSGGAIKAAHRRVGIDCLVYCMIVGLNLLWSGLKKGARIPGNATSSHQNLVLDRLRHAAYMVEGLDGAVKGGVPRTPTEGWTEKLRTARISYHGEVVAKAEPLELDRILASLPPEGFGGAVNILDVCEGEVRALLSDPERCLLSDNELPKVFPRPQVRVAPGEWEKIARALYERGIVAPTEYIINVEEVAVTNGLFGVEKTGRDLPDGRCAQRLIMDLRGSNSILKQIAGDVQTLSGACAFTTVVLDDNQIISISGDDLVSSFYLFRLPACWLPYLAFERPVSWRALGVDKEGDTFLGASVLPMGFNSSVGIMQHIHRRLALWNPLEGAGLLDNLEIRKDREWPDLDQETPVWCLYLDDSTFLRRLEMQVMESVVGRPGPEQEQMRKAYQFWGIPFNLKKAIAECEQAERLGAYLDGRKGRIGVTVKRYLECLSLGFWILSQGQTSRKSLQIYAGKEVHCLQFRRPLFSVYDEVWRLIAGPSDNPKLTEKFCMEVVVSMSLSALRFTDWRASIDPYVMASDASERGGGFCMAKRLSGKGLQAVRSGVERREGARSGIVVFDFFAGIGGFMRSLERAGLVWEHHVIVEKDKQCRRLLRRTWGGASEYPDITKITKEDLARELDRVSMLTLVVAGGGSPCQGLSRLSANRMHFDDDRSKLFYDFSDRLGDLQDLCKERNARFLGLVENVVMDESDRDEISMKLGWYPHLLESGDISRVRRPRFYWLSRDLPQAPWFEIFRHETAVKVRMFGDPEPTALWLPDGWTWQAESEAACFPTFTRPIVRRRPPPSPAGLSGASKVAKERWEEDQFRYPPYTYEDKYLLTAASGELCKLPAASREALMGYPPDHTKKLDRELFKKASPVDEEDIRQAAIGNSFHTSTVALILGTTLFHMGVLRKCRGPDELLANLLMEYEEKMIPGTAAETDTEQSGCEETLEFYELEEALNLQEVPQKDLDEEALNEHLMSRLVHIFLRKVEMRGSDIRLDTSVVFRSGAIPRTSIDPSKWEWKECRAFKWRRAEHINCLELRAALHCIQWRARRTRYHSFRTMLLIDNQSIIAVIAKGRSSSKAINHLLRRLAALCCSLNLYLLVAWVDTADNPADHASRRFDGDR